MQWTFSITAIFALAIALDVALDDGFYLHAIGQMISEITVHMR